jgi:hypothetical protein
MVTLSIELDDRLAEAIEQLASSQNRSQNEVVSEALAAYAHTARPLPRGAGKYHSGYTDTSERTRAILRDAVREREWP